MALLIFDLDDTLYKSESLRDVIGAKLALRFKEAAELPDHIDAFKEFKKRRTELAKTGEQASATHLFMKHGVSRDEFLSLVNSVDPREHVEFDENAHSVMTELAKEHELVILSNSPRDKIEKTLEALQINEHFTKIYGADDFHDSKPNPALLKHILSDRGYPASQAISIGDDVHKEILPPKKLGMKTILVKHWDYSEEDVAHADHLISDLSELPSVVKKLINS